MLIIAASFTHFLASPCFTAVFSLFFFPDLFFCGLTRNFISLDLFFLWQAFFFFLTYFLDLFFVCLIIRGLVLLYVTILSCFVFCWSICGFVFLHVSVILCVPLALVSVCLIIHFLVFLHVFNSFMHSTCLLLSVFDYSWSCISSCSYFLIRYLCIFFLLFPISICPFLCLCVCSRRSSNFLQPFISWWY